MCPSLGKWQALGVGLFSLGMLLAEGTRARAGSKWLGAFGSPASVAKRIKRFLSNDRLNWVACQVEWLRWVSSYFPVEERGLLVDETRLGNALRVMMVGLAYRQRCIALAWLSAQVLPRRGVRAADPGVA